MTDHGIRAAGNQFVALLYGYGAAPVAGEVMARPHREEKAGKANRSSHPKGPEARRPELAVEPGQRDPICREQYDHDHEGDGPQNARGVPLATLVGFGVRGFD